MRTASLRKTLHQNPFRRNYNTIRPAFLCRGQYCGYHLWNYAQFAPGMGPSNANLSGSSESRLNSYFNKTAFTSPPALGDGTGFGDAGRDNSLVSSLDSRSRTLGYFSVSA
jgi:hypothetical protein